MEKSASSISQPASSQDSEDYLLNVVIDCSLFIASGIIQLLDPSCAEDCDELVSLLPSLLNE